MGSGAGLYERYVKLERENAELRAQVAYWKKRWDYAQEELDREANKRIAEWRLYDRALYGS